MIILKKIFYERYTEPFNISIPKIYQIKKSYSSKYNCQSLNLNLWESMCGKWYIYYFNDNAKLYLYCILKRRYPVILKKKFINVFIECTEMTLKISDANVLCVSIFLRNIWCWLGAIGNLDNNEFLIYIFTGKVENGTTIIFNKHYSIVGINNQGIIFHRYWLILHPRMFIF